MAYPGIKLAALEIAYDNGGINRNRSEARHARDLSRFLARRDSDVLGPIDAWLAALSKDDLHTVCAGEETDRLRALDGSPPFTDDLLTKIFEEVC